MPDNTSMSDLSFDHPNVVGRAEDLEGGNPDGAFAFSFAGDRFHTDNTRGQSQHDATPVRRFRRVDGSERGGKAVWLDYVGMVHADTKSDVEPLREAYKQHLSRRKQDGQVRRNLQHDHVGP